MTAPNDPAQATNFHIHRKGNLIMKFRNTLVLSTSIAAAIAGIGLAAPAMGQFLTSNNPSPDDGVICRTGYTGAMVGTAFKCSKSQLVTVNLVCSESRFPNYAIRAGERDLCARDGVNIPLSGAVGGVPNQDYARTTGDSAALATEAANQVAAEAAALGLKKSDVDAVAEKKELDVDGGAGSKDKVRVKLTLYTFAVPFGSALGPSASLPR